MPGLLLNEDTDFLVSQQVLIGYQVSFSAPNYLTNFFIASGLVNPSDPGYKVLAFQRPFNIFQNLTIFYLIFVSSCKGPKWWKSYVLYAPWINGLLALADFVVIPMVTLCNIGSNWACFSQSRYGDYLALNFFISVFVMLWAPFTLVSALKNTYAEIQQEREKYNQVYNPSNDDDFQSAGKFSMLASLIKIKKALQEENKAYVDYPQEPGSGKQRLGKILSLTEGIYSLLFISNFNRLYLQKAFSRKS